MGWLIKIDEHTLNHKTLSEAKIRVIAKGFHPYPTLYPSSWQEVDSLQIRPIFTADTNPLLPNLPQRKEGQVQLQNSTTAVTPHKVQSKHNHYNYNGSIKDHKGFRTDRDIRRLVAATFNRYPIKNTLRLPKRVRWFHPRTTTSEKNFPGKTEDSTRQQKGPAHRKSKDGSPFVRNPNRILQQQKTHETELIGSNYQPPSLRNSSPILQNLRALRSAITAPPHHLA